jgi:hypothetical protein
MTSIANERVWTRSSVIVRKIIVRFAYLPCHAKIGNSANAHFVDKHILELDIPMYNTGDFVQISQSSYDLTKYHRQIVQGEGLLAVSLDDIVQRTGGTE